MISREPDRKCDYRFYDAGGQVNNIQGGQSQGYGMRNGKKVITLRI